MKPTSSTTTKGSFVKILEAALAGGGYFRGFENSHKRVQRLKSHSVSQVKAVDGQGEGEMGFADTWRSEEADIKCLLHPGHVGQAEHLLPGNAALEAEVKGIQRFLGWEVGPFSSQEVLLEDTKPLLFGEEQLHGFQRGKAVLSGVKCVKVYLGEAEVGQEVIHPFQRRQHPEPPTFT